MVNKFLIVIFSGLMAGSAAANPADNLDFYGGTQIHLKDGTRIWIGHKDLRWNGKPISCHALKSKVPLLFRKIDGNQPMLSKSCEQFGESSTRHH